MIIGKFFKNKLPEEILITSAENIRKNLHETYFFENIKIYNKNGLTLADLYDGENEIPDTIILNDFSYIFINKYEKYTIDELIGGYFVLSSTKKNYQNIVSADELRDLLHNEQLEEVDENNLENILKNHKDLPKATQQEIQKEIKIKKEKKAKKTQIGDIVINFDYDIDPNEVINDDIV